MSQSIGAPAPRRRKAATPTPHFNAQIIQFSSRPRLMVGDVVELCRNSYPGNHGKLAVVTGFDEHGFVLIRAIGEYFIVIELETGKPVETSLNSRAKPENLYRRGSELAGKNWRMQ